MRVLYVAEIVGKPGMFCVKSALSALKAEHQVDFVIANADGATGGYGLGKNHSMYLRKLGVDVVTGGDMMFYKKDMAEHIDQAIHILRPANLPAEMPGRGWRHYAVASPAPSQGTEHTDQKAALETDMAASDLAVQPRDAAERRGPEDPRGAAQEPGTAGSGVQAAADSQERARGPEENTRDRQPRVAVVSLLGQSGFSRIHGSNPYSYLENTLERIRKKAQVIIVDFHALTTAEKYSMFHFADGNVTAVIGSGQRVQTADAQVFPSGTAVLCDAGRTGGQQSVSGYLPQPEIEGYLTRLPNRSQESWDRLELQGALLEIDTASGYVVRFEALRQAVSSDNAAQSKR